MNIPEDLKYVASHEWLNFLAEDKVRFGITDFAQNAMGDIVYIELPQVGDPVIAGEPICDVESVKAVEDIYAPVTGEITAVNEALLDNPELINNAPYEAWIVEVGNVTDKEDMLTAAEYAAVCEKED